MSDNKHPTGSANDIDRLRLFIASVTDYAIYMLSPEGRVASWNAGAERFKGYKAHEIVGHHFSRFYSPEDQASGLPARALRTAREAGKFEAEGWRVRKDGSRFWASVVIDAIHDDSGELVGFAKITRDITEKKMAQQALVESEQRFRLLVQGVTDYAIYMLSPEGNVTNWNAGARRIKGYEHDDVVGTHFSRFYTPEDRASGLPARALQQAAEAGRFEAEGWRIRKDGSRFWAHVVIDPIRNEMGALVGFAKITRDITERKNAAAALEDAHEALFQAQKLEAIGKLTGGIAHDFNNLLNVVTNSISILRERISHAADLRLLDAIDHAANRGALLTHQLLSFARQQPLKQEPRDVNRVINSFEAVLRRGSRDGIAFQVSLESRLPQVLLDSAQFETALLNLVVNARDATPDGGRIVISTRRADIQESRRGLAAGSYVVVSVQDSGAGMSPEVVARAVEPFFTTKAVGQGTGLGLSQVYGMVQQSGGQLEIDSRPGEGTMMSMYFPALAGLHEEEDEDAGAEKVLIVDDQPEVLEITSELFRTLGFEVHSANSGKDALGILERTPALRLMLSNVVMPGMSGIELAHKARSAAPGIKVILSSGYANPAIDQNHASLEGFHFLPKPYRMGDLVKMLRTLG